MAALACKNGLRQAVVVAVVIEVGVVVVLDHILLNFLEVVVAVDHLLFKAACQATSRLSVPNCALLPPVPPL